MQMLRSGGRWKDCPAVYGPCTTIYNRWNRWSRQVWERIFYALTGSSDVFTGSVDSTHIKAHRSAGGAQKGGLSSRHWHLARRANNENPCMR